MCGRYSITTAPEAMRRLFDVDTALNLEPRWNMAPTQAAPVIKLDDDTGRRQHRALAMMRWGLVPAWAKDIDIGAKMINARSETVTEKPAFRAAYRYRRCVIPADGFYEWRTEAGIKQPYRVVRRDRAPFAFAGLWELWEGTGEGSALETFTILTTEANAAIAHVHHRMPVMLFEKDAFATWMGAEAREAGQLMRPCDPDAIEAFPVDRRVGNVRNDDPGLADPVDPPTPVETPRPAQGSLF
jgi:putative SOS response-associated peptidase YedK